MAGITQVVVGNQVPVLLQIPDGTSTLYPQAVIRDAEDNLLTTLDLSHADNGVYVPASAYTMPDEEFIRVTYIVYTNSGHTTESELYLRDVDVFSKNDELRHTLGLVQQNFRILNPVHELLPDNTWRMTSCTIRIYPTATDANNNTNPLKTYTMTATYDAQSTMDSYKVVEA